MGRLRAKQDDGSLRRARNLQNKAIVSSTNSTKRVTRSILGSSTPLRRSGRGKSCDLVSSPQDPLVGKEPTVCVKLEGEHESSDDQISKSKGRDIEADFTPAKISSKSNEQAKKIKLDVATPPRLSERLIGKSCDSGSSTSLDPLVKLEDQSEVEENCSIINPFLDEGEAEIDDHGSEFFDNESMQNARIAENKAILASLGLARSIRELESIMFPTKTKKLNLDFEAPNAKIDDHVTNISEYESLRNARISENKARLESLGIAHRIREFQAIVSPTKSSPKTCKNSKMSKLELTTPSRRSDRLKRISSDSDVSSQQALSFEQDELLERVKGRLYSKSERCSSKARGSIYDPVLGICCHFCRQKKLCGEEDCKRCGESDINQPCIGKTECSVCHSSNGVLCRACLKVRYGEEMEEVREKEDWMCPHCIEEKGINPYWICNSSLCLKKRKMVPTGIAIYQARAEGFKSVAHLMMDKLKRKGMML